MFRRTFFNILLLTLLTSACGPSPEISLTGSPSLTPSKTATPTFTVTPEPSSTPTQTAEQRMNQLAARAISLGWNPNDETTWMLPAGTENTADLQKLIDLDTDPNSNVTMQIERDIFVATMWRIRFEQSILDASTRSKSVQVMGHYFVSAFAPEKHTRQELGGMKPEELQMLVSKLTAEEMENLEMYRCAYNHEAMKPLFTGLQKDIDVYNQEVGTRYDEANPNIYYRPTFENGKLIGGLYGLWARASLAVNIQWLDYSYDIAVLGKPMKWTGTLASEDAWMDYGVTLRLPYHRTGIRGILLDSAQHPVRFNFIVVTDSDEPIAFSAEDFPNEWDMGAYEPEDLNLTLRTREKSGNENYHDYTWLTRDRLLGLEPFTLMRVFPPSEHKKDMNGITWIRSMFFDNQIGLPVVGSSGGLEEDFIQGVASLQFYYPGNPQP
jgi:hypothetical protein